MRVFPKVVFRCSASKRQTGRPGGLVVTLGHMLLPAELWYSSGSLTRRIRLDKNRFNMHLKAYVRIGKRG